MASHRCLLLLLAAIIGLTSSVYLVAADAETPVVSDSCAAGSEDGGDCEAKIEEKGEEEDPDHAFLVKLGANPNKTFDYVASDIEYYTRRNLIELSEVKARARTVDGLKARENGDHLKPKFDAEAMAKEHSRQGQGNDQNPPEYKPLVPKNLEELEKLIDMYPVNGVLVLARAGWCTHCFTFLPFIRKITGMMRGKMPVIDYVPPHDEEPQFKKWYEHWQKWPALFIAKKHTIKSKTSGKTVLDSVKFTPFPNMATLEWRQLANKAKAHIVANYDSLDENLPMYIPTELGPAPDGTGMVLQAKLRNATGDNGLAVTTPLSDMKALFADENFLKTKSVIVYTTSQTCGGSAEDCALMDQMVEFSETLLKEEINAGKIHVMLISTDSKEARDFLKPFFGASVVPAALIRCATIGTKSPDQFFKVKGTNMYGMGTTLSMAQRAVQHYDDDCVQNA